MTVFIVVFAGIGTYLLVGSHASTPYASINANTGTLSGCASSQVSATADDGYDVQFGNSSCGTSGGATKAACTNASPYLNSVSAIESAVSSASAGQVLCVAAGTYGDVEVSGVTPSSNVTLESAPGATVHLGYFGTDTSSGDVNNLTVQGFYLGGISGGGASTGGLTFKYDTIENLSQGIAISLDADVHGGDYEEDGITIEDNQIDHVGQCLAIVRGVGPLTFNDNVCGPYIGDGAKSSTDPGHYIESGGSNNLSINNNAFEGPADPAAESAGLHLNVLHLDGTTTNATFSNNILWHSDAIAQTVLIQEGQFTNITANNNLDVEDPNCMPGGNAGCYTESFEIYTPHGFTYKNNTVEDTAIGLYFGPTCSNGCFASGNNMDIENNVVGPPSSYATNISDWECASTCTATGNYTSDNSANSAFGEPTSFDNATSTFKNTTWTPNSGSPYTAPPSGYYVESGATIPTTAGYQGGGGPSGDVGAEALH